LQQKKCWRSQTAREREASTWRLLMGLPVLWTRVWMVDHTLLAWCMVRSTAAAVSFHSWLPGGPCWEARARM
jgi:hypothetical protein